MWILSFVVGSVLISALVADPRSELQKCQENANLDLLENLENIPEVDELAVVCPMVLDFLDCVEGVIVKYIGSTVAELAATADNPTVKKGATMLVNIRNTFTDLCTEGADLNTAYLANAECMSDVNVDAEVCTNNALTAYNTYKKIEEDLDQEIDLSDRQCLIEAYKSACIASQIHEDCGQDAFNVYQNLVKRSSIFSLAMCSEKDLENLKTKFLDSLEMEEDRHSIFRLAFDLRKRRK